MATPPESEVAPVRSWWAVPPEQFASAAATYNGVQKVLGDSELPPGVRDYLDRTADQQHRESHLLPRRPI